LPLTTLPLLRFVRVVETIVIAVANVDPRDAVAVVAGEEVAVASSVGGGALVGGLVFAAFAVAVAVAVPRGRNTAVVGASIESQVKKYSRVVLS